MLPGLPQAKDQAVGAALERTALTSQGVCPSAWSTAAVVAPALLLL